MATTLFNLCTRKRTLHTLNFLLLSHTHHFSAASTSHFRNFDAPIRSFSTHSRNPRFPSSFLQSWNLYGRTGLPMRQFSDDAGDDKDTAAEQDYEFDADAGKSVSFEPENEVNGVSSLSDSVVGENDDSVEYPVELYRALRDAKKGAKLERSEGEVLQEVFNCFAKSGWASNQALAIYIGLSFFPTAVHKFRQFFRKKCPADVARYLVSLGPTDSAVKFLFPIFVEFCLDHFPDDIKRFRSMVESADLTKPHTWFPFARAMRRKIIYHCGPTNSGKTYNALQRFMDARKGIYCSPLRLLAMEVFDKMMSDPYRGYAWTRALLGLKADEIHLCGDPSVLDIVRKICQDNGDELYEQHYERFKPLVVEAKTLRGNLQNIRSGDCVVAFSRREIFEVKLAIEKQTKHRCCVIYGALPPETRRQQATLFNDQSNEYDVLVASDAVGMGLNLNIRRVIFNSLSKYNGDKMVPVPASQVKQIAGRAGRRGCLYPDGLATTMHLDDLDYLIECLKQPFDEVKKVGLFPFYEQVELFASQLPNMTFCELLEKFGESCRLDGSYFLCQYGHIKKIANMLERVQDMSLEDRFNFCFAPVNIRDPKAMYHLLRFATTFSEKKPVNIAMGLPRSSAQNDSELLDLETRHQVLSMYLWLSNHFNQERFPFVKKAEAMATDIADLLAQSLIKANWKPESRGARGKPKTKKGEGQPESANGVVLKTGKNDYSRPRSLSKLYDRRQQDKPLQVDQANKVAA
ncbi:hypothetical protein PIB30_024229 [Stylosanthes scabra]|uniref:Helicase C-terminal domain-containing protein n=1 Tax=Stylosanthes scabra TaxID=79078 RepID=A0ABU6S9Y1_9FABA|nr:hypothetical protein [Stylosanthes scabra]